MRLFVHCGNCQNKIYIASKAKSRAELPPTFYLTCPICQHTYTYTPQHVIAETSDINPAGGALIGGLVGLVAGGIGAIIGAIAGALLGGSREIQDTSAVQRFNSS